MSCYQPFLAGIGVGAVIAVLIDVLWESTR